MRTYYVYKHTNPENGKVYIGLTSNINKRWNNGKGYKTNKAMFEDILQYGWNNFSHEILEQTNDLSAASALENKYIREYDATNPQKGYNSVYTITSKEHKLNTRKSVPVFQYSIDGDYIAEFPSAAEADRQTGITYTAISLCCNGKRKQAGNYQWSFEKHNKIPGTFVGKEKTTPKKYESQRKTKVQLFSEDGELLGEYETAKDAERKLGIPVSYIRANISGDYSKLKGFNFKKVSKISANC